MASSRSARAWADNAGGQPGLRLTWSQQHPAPFESAFSLLGKLMWLNVATWAEIWPFVGRSKAPSARLALRDSARWDFERWSEFTGLPVDALRRAFLDRLDFRIQPRRRDGIRYCEACTRWGYHCTFFDLSVIERCPWHDMPLTLGCTACLVQLSEPDAVTAGDHTCEHLYRPLHGASRHRVPEQMHPVIERHCRALLGWWLHLGERLAERDVEFGAFLEPGHAIENLGTSEKVRLEQAQYQASQLVGRCPWPLVSACDRSRPRPLMERLAGSGGEITRAHRLLFGSPGCSEQERWLRLEEVIRQYHRRCGRREPRDTQDRAAGESPRADAIDLEVNPCNSC